MPLSVGTRLGTYEVLAAIGAGGMGEVYRARDPKLNRDVAIKILPEAVATDPERLARFHREAQVLASLNHPNIAHIHGYEESNGIQALVMELVEGPTLADRIAQGPIPLNEALPIAKQIAEALEVAHEQGIIHRDLKPANIKVRDDGMVKVLDFGLSKLAEPPASSTVNATISPTLSLNATMAGVILGTAAYMSPEQARGKAVDKRADIWAFGAVLFEMLTGNTPFPGEDIAHVLARVIDRDPDWTTLPPTLSPTLRTYLRRCLLKDPRQRVRDIGDVRLALEGAFDSGPVAVQMAPRVSRQSVLWRVAIFSVPALVVGGVAVGAVVWLATRPAALRITRFADTPSSAASTVAATGTDRVIAITPDGTRIVYIGNGGAQLFVRALDQLEPTQLVGAGVPRGPFPSPDGQWIGFFDNQSLNKVAITGGPPLTLSGFTGTRKGATWSTDGTIIFATNDPSSGLLRVSDAGGEPTVLTKPNPQRGEEDHIWPALLPGSQAVLFTITSATGIDAAQVAVLDLKTGVQKIVLRGGTHAIYVPSGHLVYGAGGTLRAVAFDMKRLEAVGAPFPVLAQVGTTPTGAVNFDVSLDGTLVYVPGAAGGVVTPKRMLVWVDRQGHEEPLKAPPRAYVYPRISPDGAQVALDIRDQESDIWIWDVTRQSLRRLTFDPGQDRSPVWTPDGRRVVFSTQSTGVAGVLAWQASDGSGSPESLTKSPSAQLPTSVSPDGIHVVFFENLGTTGNDVMMLSLERDHRVQPLVQTKYGERNGEISPDGRWLTYDSNESGKSQVYVRPFPDVNSGHWQVSTEGGTRAAWARNGRELFYLSDTDALMTVPVDAGAPWRAGAPTKLFDGVYYVGAGGINARTYDVSPDGKRFLMIKSGAGSDQATAPPQNFIVVQHWTEELKRLVPTKN